MPRDLFGQMTRPVDGVGGRSRLTVPVSLAAHVAAVAAALVVPLLATDALPALHAPLSYTAIVPVVPPPPPLRRLEPRAADVAPADPDAAPLDAPARITEEPAWQRDPVLQADDGPGIVAGIDGPDVLAPPPAAAERQAPAIVRVGGEIRPPTKLHHVSPVYPPLAQAAGLGGVVILEATIGTDGQVIDLRVLRSVPLLDAAAVEAVRQWRYTPTLLNGVPVAVVMTVTVNFQLR